MPDKDKWVWYWNHDNQNLAEFVSPAGEHIILKLNWFEAEFFQACLNTRLSIPQMRKLVTRTRKVREGKPRA